MLSQIILPYFCLYLWIHTIDKVHDFWDYEYICFCPWFFYGFVMSLGDWPFWVQTYFMLEKVIRYDSMQLLINLHHSQCLDHLYIPLLNIHPINLILPGPHKPQHLHQLIHRKYLLHKLPNNIPTLSLIISSKCDNLLHNILTPIINILRSVDNIAQIKNTKIQQIDIQDLSTHFVEDKNIWSSHRLFAELDQHVLAAFVIDDELVDQIVLVGLGRFGEGEVCVDEFLCYVGWA